MLHGKLAVRVAVVLGIREERAVRLEEVDRRLEPVVELGLQGDLLSGTYTRGTTYRVPVQFRRL